MRTPALVLAAVLASTAGWFLPSPSWSAPAVSAADDAIAARIAREVEAQNIVGLSVALVRDGSIIQTHHFGWEDRERQVPASDATMYRWASISKPLTAVVAMQLWEQGRLDLDSDVRVLVPEFPAPAEEHIITCRQLLCHQGGIVHYVNGPVVKVQRPDLNGQYVDIIDALDTFKQSPLVCTPGERYSYTTHGYILLGAVVQRAGDGLYPQQVQQRIISPLGMTTLRPDYQWEKIPNRAIGYRRARGDEAMVVSTDTDVSWKLAGGGWISNVSDLALLSVGLLNHQFLKSETRDLMWMPQTTAGGEPTSYGLGFQVARLEGRRQVSHGGSQEKSRTLLTMLPDDNVAVAIMSNTEGTNLVPLGRDLLMLLIAAEPGEPGGAAVVGAAAGPGGQGGAPAAVPASPQ
jgi:serine beta-lactamase-like protein LACTB, mitochondrial